jgi:hypothetical protein
MLNASQAPQTSHDGPALSDASAARDGHTAPDKPQTRPSHSVLWWVLVAIAIIL